MNSPGSAGGPEIGLRRGNAIPGRKRTPERRRFASARNGRMALDPQDSATLSPSAKTLSVCL